MVTYIRSDLDFILDQIKIAEEHSRYLAGDPTARPLFGANGMIPANNISWGLRTVDGTYNNLIPGRTNYGAADQPFPQSARPGLPAGSRNRGHERTRAGRSRRSGGTYAPTPNSAGRDRRRFGPAHHLEPDRRQVARQPGRGGEGARPRGHRGQREGRCHRRRSRPRWTPTRPPSRGHDLRGAGRGPDHAAGRRHRPRPRDGRREPGHAERLARRGPVGVVQLVVHALRPVLRPRPRPRRQGAERHRLRPAAAGRSALRPKAATPTSWC